MKRLVLLLIGLAFLTASTGAQESPGSPRDTPPINPSTDGSAPPVMSNRQKVVMRAQILMARKDYAEAVKAYQLLLADDPKNAGLLNTVGIACQELGDGPQAEHYYKKALRADKNFASAINNLGALEYSRKHYGKAIKYYKKALTAKTNDYAVIYGNLGFAYYGNQQYPEALDSFGKALAIDPDIFARKGGAGAIIQQRSAPDPGTLYFLVAKSYAKAGDAERTAHFLKMARDDGYKDFLSVKKDPDFARVIKDPRVQEVFQMQPAYADDGKKPTQN
jgi:tetratricopeptide (TPR) repeat protein